jgi:hypothetical protein
MLNKGSPIIIIEAPKMLKTAASSIPCPNFGLVKRGNVGRYIYILPHLLIFHHFAYAMTLHFAFPARELSGISIE